MKWIKENKKNYKWLSTFPVDTPFFKKEQLKSFYEKVDLKEGKLFFMMNKNKRHNIFGLWSLDLISQLESDLQKGERKVELWADKIGVITVNIDLNNTNSFFNINTKEDLEKAKKIIIND